MNGHIKSSDGNKLAYQFYDAGNTVVVFLPGYKSDMSGTKASMLMSHCQSIGQSCLLLDYSGHGESAGEFIQGSISRWAKDATEVIQTVAPNRKVILIGSSMGGWIMLLSALALQSQVVAMLGIAIAPDFTEDLMWQQFSNQQRSELEQKGVIYLPSEYDEPLPVTYAAILDGRQNLLLRDKIAIDCPVSLLHGMLDESVPWQVSQKTLEQLTSEDVQLRLIKNGDHRLSSEEQLGIIKSLLAELIVKTS